MKIMATASKYAKDIITIAAAGALIAGAFTHFATAADVEKKFKILEISIKVVSLDSRKTYIEDQLFRLRAEGTNSPSNRAQIARFESELRDVQAKLRDLERPK